MRLLALLAASVAALAAAGAAGAATHECDGLQVCVAVAGPWVLATSKTETQYQLACPDNFVVAGLDAELTSRALDVVFRANLGSPVNPGISTTTSAVFLGSLSAGHDPAATFRPHIGCIPAAGGGQRVPTAMRVYPPGRPTTRRVSEIAARPGGTRTVRQTCKPGESLVGATHAIGFYTDKPPARALAAAVHVRRSTANGRVTVTIRAGDAVRGVRAVVQLDLVCAGGA